MDLNCEDAPVPAAIVENAFRLSSLANRVVALALVVAVVVAVATINIALAARLRSKTTNLHQNRLGTLR